MAPSVLTLKCMHQQHKVMRFFLFFHFLWIACLSHASPEAQTWHMLVDSRLANDEAINVAIHDLKESGAQNGIEFVKTITLKTKHSHVIIVGSPERNHHTMRMVEKGELDLKGVESDQGFEIVTKTKGDSLTIIVSGGSVLGEVYGLFWILDRLKVNGHVPDINAVREPELKIRFSGYMGVGSVFSKPAGTLG